MFLPLNQKYLADLLNAFAWETKELDYTDVPVPTRSRPCAEAINDIVVQICLTQVLLRLSDVSYVFVPKTNALDTRDRLLCFFQYVYQLGERDSYFLFHVCEPKENAKNAFFHAAKSGILHPLFVKSIETYRLSPSSPTEPETEMRYIPEKEHPSQNTKRTDALLDYIEGFSKPKLIGIPLLIRADDFASFAFFNELHTAGYHIYVSGCFDAGGKLTGKSVGLYQSE